MIMNEHHMHIKELMDAITNVKKDLTELLSQPDKDIYIEFDGEVFDFGQVFTREEYNRIQFEKKRFVDLAMNHCIAHYLGSDGETDFSLISSLFSGPDPKDFKLEKIEVDNGCNSLDCNIENKGSVALDTETIYVQSQRPDLDFDDESVLNEFMDKFQDKIKDRDAEKDKNTSGGI